MNISNVGGALAVHAESYTLTFAQDRPFVYLDVDEVRVAELFVLSGVHPLHDRDDTTRLGTYEVVEQPDEIVILLRAESSTWRSKTYRFRCWSRRFTYDIEVEGEGCLAEINYFGGYSSAWPRWGSGFFWSGQHFVQGFTPEPNAEERHYFAPDTGMTIDLTGVPLPGRGDWFFTPPPFCFSFQVGSSWLGLGVEAQPGKHRYTEYRYHAGRGFYLSLAYEGHTAVHGSYRLPAIGFDFAADEFEALAGHVRAIQGMRPHPPTPSPTRGEGGTDTPHPPTPSPTRGEGGNADLPLSPAWERGPGGEGHSGGEDYPAWWYEPIFCGWGAQCHVALQENGRAPDYARQDLYETFLDTLDGHGVSPGVVVLDDKWQATYGDNHVDGTKWPDLRGFVERQHARNRHVLLWLKAWDPEGLPDEECIVNAAGLRLAFDPSNPAFERRLRQSVRHMLGPDGYNADGFKIDFTARIPSGPGIRIHGDMWGLELMRRYLEIVYDEAKRVKSEALIMTHTPHPYLADVLDMIRLNDMLDLGLLPGGVIGRNINITMALRSRIAAIACPNAVIDTDSWPVADRASWREYTRLQPQLGVPSLYFVSHIDRTGEPLDVEDYELIKEAWEWYRLNRRESDPR